MSSITSSNSNNRAKILRCAALATRRPSQDNLCIQYYQNFYLFAIFYQAVAFLFRSAEALIDGLPTPRPIDCPGLFCSRQER